MSNYLTKSADKTIHQLQGDLTIYETAQVRKDILDQLNRVEQLELDLSHIAEIDTSGIQLLLALNKENNKVVFKNPAQSVTRLAQLLKLESLISELLNGTPQAQQQ